MSSSRQSPTARTESGFTLIELLVVVAIIGVLAAIAIPQYAAYRRNAYDALAQGDLRNAVGGEEALFASQTIYAACATAIACEGVIPGFRRSDNGVVLNVTVTGDSFTGVSSHINGAGGTWTYDSNGGRFIYRSS